MTHPSSAGPGRGDERLQAGSDYVELVDVSKHFGEFVAVDRICLSVARGEIFCLLGASGCGKTTLLRMLAGFETPSSGRLRLDGQDLTQLPPYRRPLNMMFQSYALFPHMNVERNVAFGLEQEGTGRAEVHRRVGEILEVVRMSDYRLRRPHQLSGGQRQRVALARALVKRPKLLLLDEPLAALDRKLREHTQFELINVQQQLGVTFIVVTHDQEEAMTLATRMGIMNQGALVQVGTARQIYEQPATRFVADFIGSVNLLDGEVVQQAAGQWLLRCPELPVPLLVDGAAMPPHPPSESGWRVGARLWLALRPEQIVLARTAPAQAHNWAQGVVREIAYRGNVSLVLVRLGSDRELRITLPNVGGEPLLRFSRDEPVYASWPSDALVAGTA